MHKIQKKPSHRQRRVAMIIRRALSTILTEQNFQLIISETRLSSDLRYADIFLRPFFGMGKDNQDDEIEQIERAKPRLRQILAKRIYLKYMPILRFHLDQSFENVERLRELLLDRAK